MICVHLYGDALGGGGGEVECGFACAHFQPDGPRRVTILARIIDCKLIYPHKH